jgi:hypothetical protein
MRDHRAIRMSTRETQASPSLVQSLFSIWRLRRRKRTQHSSARRSGTHSTAFSSMQRPPTP